MLVEKENSSTSFHVLHGGAVKLFPCIAWKVPKMKRKRDIQGKFTLKNNDYRRVRSLRLTDRTWKALGIASECLGLTRADLLENLVRQHQGNFPDFPQFEQLPLAIEFLEQEQPLKREKLNSLSEKVLRELRLGKQSSHYKVAKKALKRLIELASLPSK